MIYLMKKMKKSNRVPIYLIDVKTNETFTKDEYEKTIIQYNKQLKNDVIRVKEFEDLSETQKWDIINNLKIPPNSKSGYWDYVKYYFEGLDYLYLEDEEDEKIEILKRYIYSNFFIMRLSNNFELTQILETWKTLKEDLSKEEFRDILGEPSKIRGKDSGKIKEIWTYKYQYYWWGKIYFDGDGNVIRINNPFFV